MPAVPRVNDPRNLPRPGSLGGDPASAMARPQIATTVPALKQRNSINATGATAGAFALRIQGRGGLFDVTTAAINFNDALATVVSKLNAVLPSGVQALGISGGPLPASMTIELDGGESFTMSAVNNTLTGGTPAVAVVQTATGHTVGLPSKSKGFANVAGSAMARPKGFGR
jgi:hypothetical protein